MVWHMSESETNRVKWKRDNNARYHVCNTRNDNLTYVRLRFTYVRHYFCTYTFSHRLTYMCWVSRWFTYVRWTVTYVRSGLMPLKVIFHPRNVHKMQRHIREGPLTYVRCKVTYVRHDLTVFKAFNNPISSFISLPKTLKMLSTLLRFLLWVRPSSLIIFRGKILTLPWI